MRLTLRTLLAYLDNILDPHDARQLQKKIGDSEFATGLVHQIRGSVRRLRLDAPALDAQGIGGDLNSVAEYLDNVLPPEHVPTLEKACLDNEAHLGEVASCHQILTLVLGEPADVSDKMRARAYSIAQTMPLTDSTGSVDVRAHAAHPEVPPPTSPTVSRSAAEPPNTATTDARSNDTASPGKAVIDKPNQETETSNEKLSSIIRTDPASLPSTREAWRAEAIHSELDELQSNEPTESVPPPVATATTSAAPSAPPVSVPAGDTTHGEDYPEYLEGKSSWLRSALITGVVALLILGGLLFATTPIRDTVFAKWLGLEPRLVVDEPGTTESGNLTATAVENVREAPILIEETTTELVDESNAFNDANTLPPEPAIPAVNTSPTVAESTWTPPEFSAPASEIPPAELVEPEPAVSAPAADFPAPPVIPAEPQHAATEWNTNPGVELPEMLGDPRFTDTDTPATITDETPATLAEAQELDILPTVEPVNLSDANTGSGIDVVNLNPIDEPSSDDVAIATQLPTRHESADDDVPPDAPVPPAPVVDEPTVERPAAVADPSTTVAAPLADPGIDVEVSNVNPPVATSAALAASEGAIATRLPVDSARPEPELPAAPPANPFDGGPLAFNTQPAETAPAPTPGSAVPELAHAATEQSPAEASVSRNDQLLLMYDSRISDWIRVDSDIPLQSGDTLLGLPAFRADIEVGSENVITMIGATMLQLGSGTDVKLHRGRLVMKNKAPVTQTVTVPAGTLEIQLPENGFVAIDSEMARVPGSKLDEPVHAILRVHAVRDEAVVRFGDQEWNISEGEHLLALDRYTPRIERSRDMKWATSSAVSRLDTRAVRVWKDNLDGVGEMSPWLRDLARRHFDHRALAARCLAEMDQFGPIVAALNNPDQRAYWDEHYKVLRRALTRGSDSVERLRLELEKVHGDKTPFIMEMIGGYDSRQLAMGSGEKLVKYLHSPLLTHRVLAIQNLKGILGHHLNYRPQDTVAKRRRPVLQWQSRQKDGKVTYRNPPELVALLESFAGE